MTREHTGDSMPALVTCLAKHIDHETLCDLVYFPESFSEADREKFHLHLSVCDTCLAVFKAEQERFEQFCETTDQQSDSDRYRAAFDAAAADYLAEIRPDSTAETSNQNDPLITCPPPTESVDAVSAMSQKDKLRIPESPMAHSNSSSSDPWKQFDVSANESLAILQGKVKVSKRFDDHRISKYALGLIFDLLLKRDHHQTVFIESGSTPKLALSAADRYWANGHPLGKRVVVETNNSKIADWMPGSSNVLVHLIYGSYLNPEFGGFFPMSEEQIDIAIQNEMDNDSHAAVDRAWEEMLNRAFHYDRLFMTASRFNFLAGPFVGSKQNALLKSAFLTSGKRTAILLDGSKLVQNGMIVKEWIDRRNVQVFDDANRENELRFLKQVFGLKQAEKLPTELPGIPDELPKDLEAVWTAKTAAADRNPCYKLRLRERYIIPNGSGNSIRVDPIHSWERCVERTLQMQGELCIYVSEPYAAGTGPDFEQYLHDMIEEANGCFMHGRKRVQVSVSEMHTAMVNLRSKAILLPGGSVGAPVRIWECRYCLVDDGPDDRRKKAENVGQDTEGVPA